MFVNPEKPKNPLIDILMGREKIDVGPSRKEMADTLMGRSMASQNRSGLELMGNLAQFGVGTHLRNRSDKQKADGKAKFNETFNSVFGGGSARPAAPVKLTRGAPPKALPAVASGGDPYSVFNASLSRTESGGNYNVTNSEGFGGKYQFGQPRLNDFNRAMGTKYRVADLTAGTPEAAALTEAVQRWHVGDIDGFITKNGLDRYLGQNIGGVTMTQNGLRAMAHLGGVGGMQKFLTSGGGYNPSDSNGTSLLDYARTHAGGGAAAAPQAATGGGFDPRLVTMLGNEHASPEQKALIQTLLGQQVQASDPMRQMQLEEQRLKLNAMRNGGGTSELPSAVQELQWRAAQAGLEPGTPEYQNFVLNGGGDPAMFRALDMQAQAAGLQPGTDEYANFMATRGAGLQAGAKTEATNLANIETGGQAAEVVAEGKARGAEKGKSDIEAVSDLPRVVANAEQSIRVIDEALAHPGLSGSVGLVQGRLGAYSNATADFHAYHNQIAGKTFLEAYNTLKGGGQITEVEGKKAEAAIARLDRVQSEEGYRRALTDLREVIMRGVERAKSKAGQAAPTAVPPIAAEPNSGVLSDEEFLKSLGLE